jgi:hypothetical protein
MTTRKAGGSSSTSESATPDSNAPVTALVQQQNTSIDDMFSRSTNSVSRVKTIHFKKTLTRELTAMAHERELLFTCQSEMYQVELPMAGRSLQYGPARIIDIHDEDGGREIALICNEMMVSALERAGYRVIKQRQNPGDRTWATEIKEGTPLVGRSFAARAGDIKADKQYRVIDLVEVDLEREG